MVMALLLASIFVIYSRYPETNTRKNRSITAREVFASYKVVLPDTTFVSSTVMAGIGMT